MSSWLHPSVDLARRSLISWVLRGRDPLLSESIYTVEITNIYTIIYTIDIAHIYITYNCLTVRISWGTKKKRDWERSTTILDFMVLEASLDLLVWHFLRKTKQTRPSVNYAKDWLDQLFLIPGLVWSGKGYNLWMWSLWGVNNHFPVYWAIFSMVTSERPTGWS